MGGPKPLRMHWILLFWYGWQDAPIIMISTSQKKKKEFLDLPQPPSSHSHSMPFLRQLVYTCFSGAFPFPYPEILLPDALLLASNTLQASCSQAILMVTLCCNNYSSCFHCTANASAFFLLSSSAQTLSTSFQAHSPYLASAFLQASSASASATFQASSSCCLCHSSFVCLALLMAALCSWIHTSSSSDMDMVGGLADILGDFWGRMFYF